MAAQIQYLAAFRQRMGKEISNKEAKAKIIRNYNGIVFYLKWACWVVQFWRIYASFQLVDIYTHTNICSFFSYAPMSQLKD